MPSAAHRLLEGSIQRAAALIRTRKHAREDVVGLQKWHPPIRPSQAWPFSRLIPRGIAQFRLGSTEKQRTIRKPAPVRIKSTDYTAREEVRAHTRQLATPRHLLLAPLPRWKKPRRSRSREKQSCAPPHVQQQISSHQNFAHRAQSVPASVQREQALEGQPLPAGRTLCEPPTRNTARKCVRGKSTRLKWIYSSGARISARRESPEAAGARAIASKEGGDSPAVGPALR